MHRLRFPIVLIFALLWQSLAAAAPAWSFERAQDANHAALHLQQEGHHHHDDESYHVDDSEESARHLMADHICFAAVLSAAPVALPGADAGSPGTQNARAGPRPFLDGPLRPPRLSA